MPAKPATTRKAEPGSDLEDLVGYNLKRAYLVVQNDFRNALEQDDLSARVFSALSLVVQFPNITQSALARVLGIERSGLVAIIDALEARGYVVRSPVPGDRRVQALIPSDKGQVAYERAVIKVRAHEEKLLENLSSDEKSVLLTLLKKIREAEQSQ